MAEVLDLWHPSIGPSGAIGMDPNVALPSTWHKMVNVAGVALLVHLRP